MAEVLEDRCLLSTLSVSDVSRAEGDSGTSTFNFDVFLDEPIADDVTFDYTTVGDTAIAGEDFTPNNGTGRIVAGQTQTSIQVEVLGDRIAEPK